MKRFQNSVFARKSIALGSLLLLGALLFSCLDVRGMALRSASGMSSGLSDIEKHWSKDYVLRLTASGVIAGYPDGTFRPDSVISAAEYVTLLTRAKALPQMDGITSHWAAGNMQAALSAGWYDYDEIPPTGEKFDQTIPRQLAIKILMKALLPDSRGAYSVWAPRIADWKDVAGRYYETTLAAYEEGIAEGDGGYFMPLRGLTRGEAAALLCRGLDRAGAAEAPETTSPGPSPEVSASPIPVRSGGVRENGALKVVKTQLCSASGEPVVLRGMSSHGIQWYEQFTTPAALKALADRGANLFRIAMYTQEGGYLQNPEEIMRKLTSAIDAALAEDLYVIVDWHILSDGNPMTHLDAAKAFFAKIAAAYPNNPALLYEICNEPNGNISWSGDVKPYAEAVIPVIRAISPQSVILVGSPTWSQDIDKAARDPLKFENIMYTCHFYAGTHTQWLRDRIDKVLAMGCPVFVSEWGTSDASGNGGPYPEETERWLAFLNARGISWANWSYCDKNEASAALRPGANLADGISDNELSRSGQLVFPWFER